MLRTSRRQWPMDSCTNTSSWHFLNPVVIISNSVTKLTTTEIHPFYTSLSKSDNFVLLSSLSLTDRTQQYNQCSIYRQNRSKHKMFWRTQKLNELSLTIAVLKYYKKFTERTGKHDYHRHKKSDRSTISNISWAITIQIKIKIIIIINVNDEKRESAVINNMREVVKNATHMITSIKIKLNNRVPERAVPARWHQF